MSNVTVATPYVASTSSAASTSSNPGADIGAVIAGAVACTAAVGAWLCEKDEHDLAARDAHRAVERERRLAPPIDAIPLHCRDAETLIAAAGKLGYTTEKLENSAGQVLLRRGNGDRLALVSTTSGLVMHTSGPRSLAHEVVRQHVVDGTERYLRSRGLTPTVRQRGADIEVIAAETATVTKNPADVSAKVYADGRIRLDIDCAGNKCETIRDELTEQLGLQVEADKKKDAFFTLPGELTRTSTRV